MHRDIKQESTFLNKVSHFVGQPPNPPLSCLLPFKKPRPRRYSLLSKYIQIIEEEEDGKRARLPCGHTLLNDEWRTDALSVIAPSLEIPLLCPSLFVQVIELLVAFLSLFL